MPEHFISYPKTERLYKTIEICKSALGAAHEEPYAPHVYDMNEGCVLLNRSEYGLAVRPIRGTAVLKGILSQVMDFQTTLPYGGNKTIHPPDAVAEAILKQPSGLPRLDGIVSIPTIRPDGTVIKRPGLDEATHLYYDPPEQPTTVPENPSDEQVESAVHTIQHPFSGFPFISNADRANYFAAFITPIVRLLITGNVPLTVITSPVQGSGKTKLGICVNLLATGGGSAIMTVPARGGDDEMRKRLAARLSERPQVLVLDNIVGRFDSLSLASALTAGTWSDRRLGSSEMLVMPIRATFIATGVNIEVEGDMSRRCVWVHLDPAVDKPEERVFDFDPETYVRENRGTLVAAVLTLTRHWLALGRPSWSGRAFGSFENWANTVGGILQAAGIDGFLENRGTGDDAASRERDALAAFYAGWRKVFGNAWKRSAEIAVALSEAHKLSPEGAALREVLLEEMLLVVDQPESRAAAGITRILSKYRDRIAGGLKLVSKTDAHSKVLIWSVASVKPTVE